MPYALTFEHPHFPDEVEFGITDIGRVKNHGTLEVDEDAERQFIATTGMTIPDAFKDSTIIKLAGTSTLDQDTVNELIPKVEEVAETQTTETEQPQQNEQQATNEQPQEPGGEE